MPEKAHQQSETLCDTCRQNVAVRHFTDADMVQRHLCVLCPYPMTDWQQVVITTCVILNGKCQSCGSPAFCSLGLPGPNRFVLCKDCTDRKLNSC